MENEKKIKVVLLEPGKLARAVEIDASLAGMQKVVGGLIEPFYPFEERVCIVCNEESKINGMRPNRNVKNDDGDIEVTPELLKEPSLYPALSLIQPIKETIRVTSSFGPRKHPVKRRRLMHAGVDIAGNRGEKVVASAPGKVVYSGRKGSYGLTIDIDAGKGVTLRYAHLDKLGVRKGQKVKQGQYIGNLGRTGRVTGPHLHFEVRLRDKPINPMQFLTHEHQWASNTGTKQRKRSGNL